MSYVKIAPRVSPRHGIPFDTVPKKYYADVSSPALAERMLADYGQILDSVYEMTDMVATSNGCSPALALSQVCIDEGWNILSSQRATILEKLRK